MEPQKTDSLLVDAIIAEEIAKIDRDLQAPSYRHKRENAALMQRRANWVIAQHVLESGSRALSALSWLVHLHHGVGKAGDRPSDAEWESALAEAGELVFDPDVEIPRRRAAESEET